MSPASLLPTVDFCGHQVTRMIIGGNPFRGYSHFTPELNAEMVAYHTVDNVVETLLHAEECGINTMQSRGDEILFEFVTRYREAGGTMHWIVQTASEQPDLFVNIKDIAALNPLGIYWHGSNTDKRYKQGRLDEIEDYLKAIKDAGVLCGVASHMPHVLAEIEEKGWPVDFFMVSLYNLSKVDRDSPAVTGTHAEEPFDDEDRDLATAFIRQSAKPCIAYKVLAAGRKCGSQEDLRAAFQYAFSNLKPNDVVDVGIFQKHGDQLAQDTQIVRELLG